MNTRLTAIFLLSFLAITALCDAPVNLVQNGMFNDASAHTAFWSLRTGTLGKFSVQPSQEPGTSNVLQIVCTTPSPRPWGLELHQSFSREIPKGSVVHISFDYKLTPDYSFNFYWQEERSPWPKLLSIHIDSPAETWHRIQMAVPIHETQEPDATAFSFHLAEKEGTLLLRNISAILLPPGTNPDALTTNATPVLGGDFYDKDWREHAQKQLQATRTTTVFFNALRRDSSPVPNATITIKQLKRHFRFGAETTFPLFSQAALNRPENKDLATRLAPLAQLLPKHKAAVTDNSLFSFITFTDGFVWRESDAWASELDSAIVKEANDLGLQVRGHALFIPAFMFAPTRCRKLDRADLENEVMKHITDLASRHGASIPEWNVLHGGIDYAEIYNTIGVECLPQACLAASQAAPQSAMLFSDLQGLSALSEIPLRDSVELADWLIQNNVKLAGIVLGANMKRLDVAPQTMEKRINFVTERLHIPIHIANFAVNTDSEEFQKNTMADYLLLFYSCANVASVSFAESWAPVLLNPKMALFNEDMTPRPAAKLIKELLTQTWTGNKTLKTAEGGQAEAILFDGIYQITATDGKETADLTLDTRTIPQQPRLASINIKSKTAPKNTTINLFLK